MEIKEKIEFKSEALKRIREEKGYKQDELAKEVFTTRQSISNWENGKKLPTLENVNRLAQVLEVSIDDLIVRKVEEKLKINDEKLVNYNDNYTDLLFKPSIKKDKKYLKFIKILLALIIIILIIYLGNCIRKFVILYDINNKIKNYNYPSNYFYSIKHFEYDNKILTGYYEENGYYKDDNLKVKIRSLDGDYLHYFLNENYYYIDLNNDIYVQKENCEAYNPINLMINKPYKTRELFINAINFKSKLADPAYYYLFYKTNINDEVCNVFEKIDKTSGLIKEREISSSNYTIKDEYYIEDNKVKDKDLELINLDDFIKK